MLLITKVLTDMINFNSRKGITVNARSLRNSFIGMFKNELSKSGYLLLELRKASYFANQLVRSLYLW